MRRPALPVVCLALLVAASACSSPAVTPSSSPAPSVAAPSRSPAPSDRPTPTPTASPRASGSPTTSPSPSGEPTAEPTAQPTPVSGTTYTVKRGDGLFAIARSFGTTVERVQDWNAPRYPSLASNPNLIEPGWQLIVSLEPGVTPAPTPKLAPSKPPTPRTAPGQPSGGGRGEGGCTAGTRAAPGPAQIYRTIPNAGAGVALTFDMGGRMDPAVDIMNFLVAKRVCATIFATGVMSETARGRQVMTIIKANPQLFEIANHTMYHCDLARGGGGSPTTAPCQTGGAPGAAFVRQELAEAEAILRAGTGQNPQPYWRPPYGSISDAVIAAAASVGYMRTFLWDIDTIDWRAVSDGGPTAQQIAAKVVGNAVNGSNVLFHLGGYETLDALELIVPALRDRGFRLTSLSDLLN